MTVCWHRPVMVERSKAPSKDVVINKTTISVDKQLPHV
jgi:hypothetical protein